MFSFLLSFQFCLSIFWSFFSLQFCLPFFVIVCRFCVISVLVCHVCHFCSRFFCHLSFGLSFCLSFFVIFRVAKISFFSAHCHFFHFSNNFLFFHIFIKNGTKNCPKKMTIMQVRKKCIFPEALFFLSFCHFCPFLSFCEYFFIFFHVLKQLRQNDHKKKMKIFPPNDNSRLALCEDFFWDFLVSAKCHCRPSEK